MTAEKRAVIASLGLSDQPAPKSPHRDFLLIVRAQPIAQACFYPDLELKLTPFFSSTSIM